MMELGSRLRITETQRDKDRERKDVRGHEGSQSSLLLEQGQLCQTRFKCLEQYEDGERGK